MQQFLDASSTEVVSTERRSYIEMEVQLGEIDRVRTLYQKFLEWAPANCSAWCKFADLERSLGELHRARAIFELAIAQPLLDMPEQIWKVPNTLLSIVLEACGCRGGCSAGSCCPWRPNPCEASDSV